MACNCEGKKYNISLGCCVPVLAPIENYYTKYQIDEMLEEIETSGVTEEVVDEKIASAKTEIEAEIPSLDGYATEEWVGEQGYLTEHQSLSAYSTTEQMNNAITAATDGLQESLIASSGLVINNNTIGLDLPIYKGSGSSSVSIGSANGLLGGCNLVKGLFATAVGWGLKTNNVAEVALGGYNKSFTDQEQIYGSSGKTTFSVGNGGYDESRHNAFEVRQNGDIYIANTNDTSTSDYWQKPMIKLQDTVSAMGGLKFVSLTQSDYDDLVDAGTTDANTIYFIKGE